MPASPSMFCGRPGAPHTPLISVRGPCVPGPTVTPGEPRTTTVEISLTVHKKTPLLTVGDGAGSLQGGTQVSSESESCAPLTDLSASLLPGSARTRHRFGEEVWTGGVIQAARRDGWHTLRPTPRPGREDPRREEITTKSHRATKPTAMHRQGHTVIFWTLYGHKTHPDNPK
jgi:hypothetical protein